MFVVRDVWVSDQVECVGLCNLFAAGLVARTNFLAQTPKFIRIGLVSNLFEVWVPLKLAMFE